MLLKVLIFMVSVLAYLTRESDHEPLTRSGEFLHWKRLRSEVGFGPFTVVAEPNPRLDLNPALINRYGASFDSRRYAHHRMEISYGGD